MAKQSFPSTFSLKTLLVWHKNTNLKILHEPITRFSCPPQSLSQAVDLSPPASPSASGGVSCTNLCSSPPATAAYPHGDVTLYSIKSQNQRIGGKEGPAEVRRSSSLLSKIFTQLPIFYICQNSLAVCPLSFTFSVIFWYRSCLVDSPSSAAPTAVLWPGLEALVWGCQRSWRGWLHAIPPCFTERRVVPSKDGVNWPIPPVGLLPCALATCLTRLHCTQHHSSTSSEGPLLLKGVENHFIKEKKNKRTVRSD